MVVDNPVRIQVLSDLHLDSDRSGQDVGPFRYQISPHAEILALLGDIGVTCEDALFEWLLQQLEQFKLVFFLSGNHEAYHSSLAESHRRLIAFAEDCNKNLALGRFVLLNRTRYDLTNTVTVLGCTLWSKLDDNTTDTIQAGLKDLRMIDGFTFDTYQNLHELDAEWLKRSILDIHNCEPHRVIIVMTHHAPTVEGTSHPKYRRDCMSSAFSTELLNGSWGDGLSAQVKVWMFGHTHWPCDFVRNQVRVISNPRGYRDGEGGYDPEKVVEI